MPLIVQYSKQPELQQPVSVMKAQMTAKAAGHPHSRRVAQQDVVEMHRDEDTHVYKQRTKMWWLCARKPTEVPSVLLQGVDCRRRLLASSPSISRVMFWALA